MHRQPSELLLPSLEQTIFGPTRQCPQIFMPPDDSEDEGVDGTSQDGKSVEGDDDEQGSMQGNTGASDDRTNANHTTNGGNGMPQTGGFSDKISSSAIDILYDSLDLGHWAEAAKEYDIPLPKLRRIVSQGIPDEGSYRAITWRILLTYLPAKDIQESWNIQVPPKREFYRNLVLQYFQHPMEGGCHLRGQLTKTVRNRSKSKRHGRSKTKTTTTNGEDDDEEEEEDDSAGTSPKVVDLLPPKFKEQWKRSGITLDKMTTATSSPQADLNLNHLKVPPFDDQTSTQEEFQEFLEDAMLLEEIRKDVARTLPHLLFFLEPNDNLGLRRYAALERILFLWAKLNKGVRYVQGMNEIAGTIYYVLANDHNSTWANYAEMDTYFLFHALMMDIRDVFVPDMDSHSTGIQGRIETMERLLETHDPEVYHHLQKCGIDSHFYAYRWLTTLLSREFLLPDTIRLWDSMFASTHKDNFLRYVCVTMVMRIREELLDGDFSSNLRLLQRYPPANVDAILDSSRSLWMYETKIRITCDSNGMSVDHALQMVAPPPGIIMAFGLKKGVASNLKHRLEGATENLIGRAQRFLSGFRDESIGSNTATGSGGSGNIMSPTTETAAATAFAEASTPPRPRFWNRARRNSNDSDTNLGHDDEPSYSTTASQNNLASSYHDMQDTLFDAPASNGGAATTPRRLIWNRSPATRTTMTTTPDRPISMGVNLHDAEQLPTLQTPTAFSTDMSTSNGASSQHAGSASQQPRWPLAWKRGPNDVPGP